MALKTDKLLIIDEEFFFRSVNSWSKEISKHVFLCPRTSKFWLSCLLSTVFTWEWVISRSVFGQWEPAVLHCVQFICRVYSRVWIFDRSYIQVNLFTCKLDDVSKFSSLNFSTLLDYDTVNYMYFPSPAREGTSIKTLIFKSIIKK